MTLQEFSTSSPATTEIRFFVGPYKTVQAMNISSTACNSLNTFDALGGITKLTVPIGGTNYTFNITTRELKSGYYFFTVEELYIPTLTDTVSDSDDDNCNFVTFLPSANDATFETSEYNATFGNAVDIRLNSFFYDVDRIKNQIKPTNYDSIISGSANFAPIPDSNYTSIGFTRSRYLGCKTTEADFGIHPALIATNFEGAVYTINKEDITICSQSLSVKPIQDYLFSPNLRYKPSNYLNPGQGQSVDAFETPSIRKGLIEVGSGGIDFDSSSTSIQVDGNPDIKKGDHLLVLLNSLSNEGISGRYEYLHVTGTFYSESGFTTDIFIEHQAFARYGDTSSVTITDSDSYAIYILFGDAIYKPNGGQIYRIADKKLYVPETDSIFITDERGQIVYLSSTCTI